MNNFSSRFLYLWTASNQIFGDARQYWVKSNWILLWQNIGNTHKKLYLALETGRDGNNDGPLIWDYSLTSALSFSFLSSQSLSSFVLMYSYLDMCVVKTAEPECVRSQCSQLNLSTSWHVNFPTVSRKLLFYEALSHRTEFHTECTCDFISTVPKTRVSYIVVPFENGFIHRKTRRQKTVTRCPERCSVFSGRREEWVNDNTSEKITGICTSEINRNNVFFLSELQ